MEKERNYEIPKCKICGSRQVRTTRDYRICIRCGNKEKVE